jgi:hypothetical protein
VSVGRKELPVRNLVDGHVAGIREKWFLARKLVGQTAVENLGSDWKMI